MVLMLVMDTYTENKIEGRISAVSTIPSELMTERDDKQYVFCLVEGGNGTRYLSMVVTRNGKKPIVYDELQTLNDSKSPEFNDFRNLRNKLLQDKFIAVSFIGKLFSSGVGSYFRLLF